MWERRTEADALLSDGGNSSLVLRFPGWYPVVTLYLRPSFRISNPLLERLRGWRSQTCKMITPRLTFPD
jgi:hypothetical protein